MTDPDAEEIHVSDALDRALARHDVEAARPKTGIKAWVEDLTFPEENHVTMTIHSALLHGSLLVPASEIGGDRFADLYQAFAERLLRTSEPRRWSEDHNALQPDYVVTVKPEGPSLFSPRFIAPLRPSTRETFQRYVAEHATQARVAWAPISNSRTQRTMRIVVTEDGQVYFEWVSFGTYKAPLSMAQAFAQMGEDKVADLLATALRNHGH